MSEHPEWLQDLKKDLVRDVSDGKLSEDDAKSVIQRAEYFAEYEEEIYKTIYDSVEKIGEANRKEDPDIAREGINELKREIEDLNQKSQEAEEEINYPPVEAFLLGQRLSVIIAKIHNALEDYEEQGMPVYRPEFVGEFIEPLGQVAKLSIHNLENDETKRRLRNIMESMEEKMEAEGE